MLMKQVASYKTSSDIYAKEDELQWIEWNIEIAVSMQRKHNTITLNRRAFLVFYIVYYSVMFTGKNFIARGNVFISEFRSTNGYLSNQR